MLDVQGGQVRVVTVATGLVHPWSIALLPEDRSMLVAERSGPIRLIRNDVLVAEPVWSGRRRRRRQRAQVARAAPALRGEPARLSFVSEERRARHDARRRARPLRRPASSTTSSEIFVADAWETGGNLGGKILFGPDETLYVTIGDRDRLCCTGTEDNSLRMKAQDLSTHVGKTLRIRDDGSVPPDNPFVGRAGAKPEIFTYGHRNGYGLAFHPETGELWQAEIGPMGGDEVNILLPGHNYGWPLVSMGRNYTGSLVSDQPFYRDGMDNARMFWVPSISPSSLMFYTGERFPQWRGQHVRRRAERLELAARRVRSTVAGGAARAGAARARHCASATCSRPATASSTSRPSSGSAAPRPTARSCGSSPSKARSVLRCDVDRRAPA